MWLLTFPKLTSPDITDAESYDRCKMYISNLSVERVDSSCVHPAHTASTNRPNIITNVTRSITRSIVIAHSGISSSAIENTQVISEPSKKTVIKLINS